jgi:hypothetical protein
MGREKDLKGFSGRTRAGQGRRDPGHCYQHWSNTGTGVPYRYRKPSAGGIPGLKPSSLYMNVAVSVTHTVIKRSSSFSPDQYTMKSQAECRQGLNNLGGLDGRWSRSMCFFMDSLVY